MSLFAAIIALLGAGCSSTEQPTDTPDGAAVDAAQVDQNELCTTPLAQQLGEDNAVAAMETAAKEHVPTQEELKTAVAYLVLLADAKQTGRLHENFFRADLQRRMLTLAKKYPSFFGPCDGTASASLPSIGTKRWALKVPDCNDDCGDLVWEAVGKQIKAGGMMLLDKILGKVLADPQGSKLVAHLQKEYDAANTYILMINTVTAQDVESVARVVADFMATALGEVPGLGGYALAIEVGIFAIDTVRALADAQVDYETCLAMQQKLCQDAGPPDGAADAGVDAAPDLGQDASPDLGQDAAPDAAEDSGSDMNAVDQGEVLDQQAPDTQAPDAAPAADTAPAADATVCAAPLTNCSGTCVDLQSDPLHCGKCPTACSGNLCVNGNCLDNCGNGTVDPGESCDLSDLGYNGNQYGCFELSYEGGTLSCKSNCTYNAALCGPSICPPKCTGYLSPYGSTSIIYPCDCAGCSATDPLCQEPLCPAGCLPLAKTYTWPAGTLSALDCECPYPRAGLPSCAQCSAGKIYMSKTWWPTGALAYESWRCDRDDWATFCGPQANYDQAGDVTHEGTYKDNLPCGVHKTYNKDYVADPSGIHFLFEKKDQMCPGTSQSELCGTKTLYFSNGNIWKLETNVVNGSSCGTVTTYDKTGAVISSAPGPCANGSTCAGTCGC